MAAAARDNAYEVLLKLINSGANINARDKSGQTALSHAIYRKNDAAATALIEAGALGDQNKMQGTPY